MSSLSQVDLRDGFLDGCDAFLVGILTMVRAYGMYKKVLIATDGSQLANKDVKAGLKLARALNSDVALVTVIERWPLVKTAAQAEMGVKDPIEQTELVFDDRRSGADAVKNRKSGRCHIKSD